MPDGPGILDQGFCAAADSLMASAPPTISQAFSALGARLAILEGAAALPPLDEVLLAAFLKIGINFSLAQPRYVPVKTVDNTPLPDGAYRTGNLLRVQSGASVLYEGWNFTGVNVYCETGAAIFRDCYIPNQSSPCLHVVGTANVLAEFCDMDGQRGPNAFSLVFQPSDNASYTIRDSRIHGGGGDCAHMASNSTIERSWLYDTGYAPGAHPDLMQISTAAGVHANITVRNNLLVGGGPAGINQLFRGLAESQPGQGGSSTMNVSVTGNVGIMPSDDIIHSPFAIGRRTSPANAAGLAAQNYECRDNWLAFGNPLVALPSETPTNGAVWTNNRRLDTSELITPPPGWSS